MSDRVLTTPSINDPLKNKYYLNLNWLNSLLPGVPFLYPLKTSENRGFSDVFRRYKKGTPGSNGLISSISFPHINNKGFGTKSR